MSESKGINELRAFVKSHTISVNVGRKCVDGRYLPNQSTGMMARPGGDAGYVLALLAVNKKKNLGLTSEECFDLVYEAVKDEQGFFMHTDDSSAELIGCGHLAKAANATSSSHYGIDPEAVSSFIHHACTRDVHMVKLSGEHKEQGVIVVKDQYKTVYSCDPRSNQMYFIYDEDRDNDFLKKLVDKIGRTDVTYTDLKAASDLQLQATLKNLALGLSIYTLRYVDGEPEVSFNTIVS